MEAISKFRDASQDSALEAESPGGQEQGTMEMSGRNPGTVEYGGNQGTFVVSGSPGAEASTMVFSNAARGGAVDSGTMVQTVDSGTMVQADSGTMVQTGTMVSHSPNQSTSSESEAPFMKWMKQQGKAAGNGAKGGNLSAVEQLEKELEQLDTQFKADVERLKVAYEKKRVPLLNEIQKYRES